jgi:YD repeat-containing protein
MLGRFGDIPIGYYTGTADISIPLYTIREGSFEIPIVLRYNGSGIKVEDQASNVGLGWNLEAEGSIIQEVLGDEDANDELVTADPSGYQILNSYGRILGAYSARNEMGYNGWGCAPPYNNVADTRETLNRLLLGDGQPDIYSFNFAGHSGKFYVNPETHQVIQLNQKEVITFTGSGGPAGTWTATTMDGDIFYFTARETASTQLVLDHTGYTYKLTSIYLHTGRWVQFQYAPGYYSWFIYSETYHTIYPFGLNPTGDSYSAATPHFDVSKHNTQNLTQITGSDVTVNFNWEDRADLIGEADIDTIPNNGTTSTKRLRSIDIISSVNGNKIKSFTFSYSYFPYSTVGGDYANINDTAYDKIGLRLRLDSLTETGYLPGGASASNPPYIFAYDSSSVLPLKTSFARDFWGYYNGKNNTGLIPNLAFFYYDQDPLYTGVPENLMDSTFTSDRSPDSLKMMAGMLKRITYPTGGYSEFDYSPNTFGNYYYPDAAKEAATRRQNFCRDMNNGLPYDTLVRAFQLDQKCLVHFNCQISAGSPLQGLTFSDMQPAYITLEKGNNGIYTTLQTWQLQQSDTSTFRIDQGSVTWTQDIVLDTTSSDYYVVTVSLPNSLGPQNTSSNTAYVMCTYTYYDTVDNPLQRSLGGGVRISDVRNYAGDGKLSTQKIFRYVNSDSSTSGLLMSPLQYFHLDSMNFIALVSWNDNPATEYGGKDIWSISGESIVPFSDAATGNIVGYSRVEETEVDSLGNKNGVHIYEYNNTPSQTEPRLPDNPHLTNGLQSRETILNATLDTLAASTFNYQDIQPISFNGVKIFSIYMGVDPCDLQAYPDGSGWQYGNFPLIHKYLILWYPLNSHWYVQQQKTKEYYAGAGRLMDTTSYTYNRIGQVSTETSYNSKGQKFSVQSTYPYDSLTGIDDVVALMQSNSLFNDLLVRSTSVNDTITASMRFHYDTINNRILQTYIDRSFIPNPYFTDITFDDYGPDQNIRQFTQRGSTTTLIWNYSYNDVIARVANAPDSAVAYTSFEDDGLGGFNLNPGGTILSNNIITGSHTYSGGVNKTVPSGNYTVSCWAQGNITVNGQTGTQVRSSHRDGTWYYYEWNLSNVSSIQVSGDNYDEVRLYPVGAQMTTYTWSPLVGITSECDPNNKITYYEYDPLGRLLRVRDMDYNILKQYDYRYQISHQ